MRTENNGMKQNSLFLTLGCAAMMAAFGLTACGDDSSSSPGSDPEQSSSSVEQSSSSIPVTESSSSETAGSSSVENCIHMSEMPSDSESENRWDCAYPDYTLGVDCENSETSYMCASGMWIEAKDCDPSQERCGYSDTTLCTQFGIMKYCNGPLGIFPVGVPCNTPGKSVTIDGQWLYRCDNGKWHVVVPMGGY